MMCPIEKFLTITTTTPPQAMSTSLEIKQQVAVLMRKLVEAKQTERRAVEEEEPLWHIVEEEARRHEELEQCWAEEA